MFFKRNKPKKSKNKEKSLLILLIGGFLLTLVHLFKKDKIKEFEQKIKDFSKEEKREIKELCDHEEGYVKFCNDSAKLFKDYFIPYNGNSHKPRILRSRALFIIALVLLLVKVATVGYLFLSYPQGARTSEVVVNEVLRLVNLDRSSSGAGELKMNFVLNKSALAKANDLVENDYFAHTSLDGKKPWDWIDRKDYAYIYVGENLAMNFTTAQSVHRALMNSPSHKKNILNERYTDVGFAMTQGKIDGKKTNILVQHFSTRASTVPGSVKIVSAPIEEAISTPVSEPEPSTSETEVLAEAPVEKKIEEKVPGPVPPLPEVEIVKNLINNNKNLARVDTSQVEPELKTLGESNEKEIIEPEYLAMDAALAQNIKQVSNRGSDNFVPVISAIKYVNYFFLTVAIILAVLLLINIIVRIEIQHKPVIIQTLVLILFIFSLIYFKFHIMESGITDIFLI
ncbi:MAG: CAP domain-containing protein [Patescibacteria group bacterium]|nr:CAP domain-containing protein [Patescibacteria group bacterium]